MEGQFKTLTIDFADTDDRNVLFEKICELRCLNIDETKKKMSIKGNVPYGKVIELCNAQGCDMKLLVAVNVKPAVGAVVDKNPAAIKETPVDTIPSSQGAEGKEMSSFTSVKHQNDHEIIDGPLDAVQDEDLF